MATLPLLRVQDQPVVLCFIAWMRDYNGVQVDDVPVWDSARAKDGFAKIKARARATYFLGETSNFTRARSVDGTPRAFGHVQARFNTRRLGGTADAADGVTIVWCAADPLDRNSVRVVGWYRSATVHRAEVPFGDHVLRGDRKLFPSHDGFNVQCKYSDAKLLDEASRPILALTPGHSELKRWHAQSKNWYGDGSAPLAKFLERVLAGDKSLARRNPRTSIREPIKKTTVIQTVRERQGQTEFRNALLIAYAERCAISGCTTTELLDACHIFPAKHDNSTHGLDNGLLLRTDLHTLFDLGLLAIHPKKRTVWLSPVVHDDTYTKFRDKPLKATALGAADPSTENLEWSWERRAK